MKATMYKTFDGKRFTYDRSTNTKAEANVHAERSRKQGYLVRVVKTTPGQDGRYSVYRRG
jgi:hypothetical protein